MLVVWFMAARILAPYEGATDCLSEPVMINRPLTEPKAEGFFSERDLFGREIRFNLAYGRWTVGPFLIPGFEGHHRLKKTKS